MEDEKQMQEMRKKRDAQELLGTLHERGTREGWLIDKAEITIGPILGKGAFGTTYSGAWRGENVAIKVVRVSDTSELINFLREVQSMSVLRHPNIVTFLGAVLCSPTDFWLLTEFMPGGTLASWLHPTASTRARQAAIAAAASKLAPLCHPHGTVSPTGSSSPQTDGGFVHNTGGGKKRSTSSILHLPPYIERLTMALEPCLLDISYNKTASHLAAPTPMLIERQAACFRDLTTVAQGLMVLESCTPPIIHRDVKPSNVLIDAAGHARLADFGLSRQYLSSRRAEFTGETGTYLYMAPEMMRHEIYDCKVDVWSWGVLFVEAITCQMPYVERCLSPEQLAMGVSEHNIRPDIPQNIDRTLKMVADMACQFEPEQRADFQYITSGLTSAIHHLKADGIREPMGLLSRLHHSLTSPWGEILGRMYPVTAQHTADSIVRVPRGKLHSHKSNPSQTVVESRCEPMDIGDHESPPTSYSGSSQQGSPLRERKSGDHAGSSGEGGSDALGGRGGGDGGGRFSSGGGGGSGASGGSSDVQSISCSSAPFQKLSIDR